MKIFLKMFSKKVKRSKHVIEKHSKTKSRGAQNERGCRNKIYDNLGILMLLNISRLYLISAM